MPAFHTVPILDWKLVESGHKDQFLLELRDCLINVGFLYLKNPPVDPVMTIGFIYIMIKTNLAAGPRRACQRILPEIIRPSLGKETFLANV
jgi:hypothetical protein